MRTVQTFVLRLLIDPAEPETLRGALSCVPGGENRTFVGEEALLALLRQINRPERPAQGSAPSTDQDLACTKGRAQ